MKDAADRGAEAVIVACPMCHSNLDMRREAINSYLGEKLEYRYFMQRSTWSGVRT